MNNSKVMRLVAEVAEQGFFERVFTGDVNFDLMLEKRDSEEFDRFWTECDELVGDIKSLSVSDEKVIDGLREYVFKAVYRITVSSDLAGYASDDFGLIGEAFSKECENSFVEGIYNAYTTGLFPG